MKKSNLIYLFVLLVGMACLDACKKKEDPAPVPRKELLASTSSKKWKITSATAGGYDAFASRDACERDNLYIFFSDNKLTVDEGATKCNSGDPQTAATGTWSLSTDEKTLTLNAGSSSILSGDFTITELSSNTLKGKFTYNGIPLDVILTAQ
jgi:hypothetical protein